MSTERWRIQVEVLSPVVALAGAWEDIEHRTRLCAAEGDALRAWARWGEDADGEAAARAAGETFLRERLAAAPAAVREHPGLRWSVDATPASRLPGGWDEGDEPQGEPAWFFAPSLHPVGWDGAEPADAAGRTLRLTWFSGREPVGRLRVDETPQRVTVTIYERRPPMFDDDGVPTIEALVRVSHTADVSLDAPLGARTLIDGFDGTPRSLGRLA